MEKILFYLFIVLVITTPFLYRFIRLGNISWFVKKDQLGPNPNYDKAENLRFIQIILGLCYFIFHGLTLWGWTNIGLFMFIAFVFSMSMGQLISLVLFILFIILFNKNYVSEK